MKRSPLTAEQRRRRCEARLLISCHVSAAPALSPVSNNEVSVFITVSPLRAADRHSPVLHGVLHLRLCDVEMMSGHDLSHERRRSLQKRPTVTVHCHLYRCLSHKLGADNVKGPYLHHFSPQYPQKRKAELEKVGLVLSYQIRSDVCRLKLWKAPC